jgi:leucyl-tRNA synthetase
MELLNEMIDYVRFLEEKGASFEEKEILVFASRTLVSLLNPIAPHLSEELWQLLGEKDLLSTESWPVYQKEKMYEEEVEVIVQINGRVRSKVVVSRGSSKEEVLALALQDEKVKSWLNHGEIKKSIYVPDKLINLVVG